MFYLNDKVKNNSGEEAEIVSIIKGSKKIERKFTLRFTCGTEVVVSSGNLTAGKFKNPSKANVYGVGYLGQGDYKCSANNSESEAYTVWNSMMGRCYGDTRPESYSGVSVHQDWHNFQIFAEWFYSQKGFDSGFELDKDIIRAGNKVYSQDSCCLVPKEINLAITKKKVNDLPVGVSKHASGKYRARLNRYGKEHHLGLFDDPESAFKIYKTEKQKYLKELADKWREQVDDKVYQALLNYEVA